MQTKNLRFGFEKIKKFTVWITINPRVVTFHEIKKKRFHGCTITSCSSRSKKKQVAVKHRLKDHKLIETLMHVDGLMDQFTQPVCNEFSPDHQKR